MKKLATLAVIFAALFSACKEMDYKAAIEQEEKAFFDLYNTTVADSSMPEDKQDSVISVAYDRMKSVIYDIATKALSKHNDDSLAVDMVLNIAGYELTDNENIIRIIDALGPNAASNEQIVAIRSNIEVVQKTAEGKGFIDFSVKQPDGSTRSLSDYAGCGKYCIVDFWASWCGPCRREIPYLQKAWEKYAKKGLEMVSVAVWDKPEDSVAAAQECGIQWNQILDAGNVPTDLYGVTGIPFIMLIGPDGTILARDLRGDDIAATVGKYL